LGAFPALRAGNRAFRLYLLPPAASKGYRCNPLRESKPLRGFDFSLGATEDGTVKEHTDENTAFIIDKPTGLFILIDLVHIINAFSALRQRFIKIAAQAMPSANRPVMCSWLAF
jgi:hypothetical protein